MGQFVSQSKTLKGVLFKSYCNSSDLGFLSSGGGAGGCGVSGVISYSLYEFRNVQR